jgi:hypothetical protein
MRNNFPTIFMKYIDVYSVVSHHGILFKLIRFSGISRKRIHGNRTKSAKKVNVTILPTSCLDGRFPLRFFVFIRMYLSPFNVSDTELKC